MTQNESYDVDLTHLDEEFAETEVPEQEFSPLPDGRYQVVVDRAEITTAQSSGNPMLKWTMRILGPAFRDRLLWKNSVLLSGLLQYVKKDLQTCGIHLQRFSDLSNQLEKLLDIRLEIMKKTKNGSENIFINKRLSGTENSYEEAAEEAKTPF